MRIQLLFFALILTSLTSKAQIQDLATLSTGENIRFSTIYDSNEELYGYFVLFYKGMATESTRNFEYVILDNNLNPVANKDFEAENTVLFYRTYINFKGELVMVPELDTKDYNIFNYGNIKFPERLSVNLETNEIEVQNSLCYDEEGEFIECPDNAKLKEIRRQIRQNRKDNKDFHDSSVYELKRGGYLVYEERINPGIIARTSDLSYYAYKRYDANKDLIWEYTYTRPENARRNEWRKVEVYHMNEDYLYLLETHNKKKNYNLTLVQLDIDTGDVKIIDEFDSSINSQVKSFSKLTSTSRRNPFINKKTYGNALYTIGYKLDKKDRLAGYSRLTIDQKTGAYTIDDFNYLDLKKHIKINARGKVEKGYYLHFRDIYIMEDGKTGLLFEKFKYGSNFFTGTVVPKATDLIYITTDKDFNVHEVKTLKKDRSKHNYSDYMYSQYLNNNKDVVFFYRNYQKDEATKEKNWNLFINTVIDGVYNQEVVPISSEDNLIYPYVAKEGYILLREYNKDSKYNQIRLEKLNF